MLTEKLEKILKNLETNLEETNINKKELLEELKKLRKVSKGESLGTSSEVCPCCKRLIKGS